MNEGKKEKENLVDINSKTKCSGYMPYNMIYDL